MMASMRSSIRLRLVLGLAAIIALGAGGAAHHAMSMHAVESALVDIRLGGDAERSSLLLATSIRRQYCHEAHVLLMPEPEEHVAHFATAVKETEACLWHLDGVITDLEARDLLAEIREEVTH